MGDGGEQDVQRALRSRGRVNLPQCGPVADEGDPEADPACGQARDRESAMQVRMVPPLEFRQNNRGVRKRRARRTVSHGAGQGRRVRGRLKEVQRDQAGDDVRKKPRGHQPVPG